MPRTARIILPHTPHHIVHRGHNRQSIFAQEGDYRYYLGALKMWKREFGVKLYAYCLMTNHVHLVLDPGPDDQAISALMKRVAGRYARYANRLKSRSGALWETRFKSSPVQTDTYLLACVRYVELNPVRAFMVSRPEKYPWSSYRQKIEIGCFRWIDLDPCYLALGETAEKRCMAYAAYVSHTIPDEEWALIRLAVARGQLTGDRRFVDEVAYKTGRRIEPRGRGRPRLLRRDVERRTESAEH